MSRSARRREVIAAQHRLVRESAAWDRRTFALRARIARHREAVIVGSGFFGGIVTGLLPLRGFANATRAAVGMASFLLRNPLGTWLVHGLRLGEDSAPAQPEIPAS